MNTKKLYHALFNSTKTRVAYHIGVTLSHHTPVVALPRRCLSTTRSTWSTMAHDKTCWQCQSTNKPSALFCENKVCQVIQPVPAQLNFFHLLGVGAGENKDEPTFNVDLKIMKKRFLSLQQKAHPDSYSQAPKRELDYAQIQSSVINKAYNTLKNPLSRAKYLLKENNIEVNEGDSLSDPSLLMEVMEFREELEEITSEKELVLLKKRNDEKYEETVQKLQEAFDKKDFKLAKDLSIELQYWNSIQSAIHEWHP